MSSESSLPIGWAKVPLNEIATHHSGDSKIIKGKLPSEPAADLFPAYSASGQDVWRDAFDHKGDAIVISAVGARCGKCFKASGEWSAIANTHVVWPIAEAVDRDFLWFKVNDEHFWVKGGSAQPFVKTRDSFKYEFSLPPLPEQQRIVEKIETLFARLDKGEEAVREVQRLLTRYRQSLLKSAVTGQLTADWRAENNALEWEEIELGDITDFLTSGSRGWAKYYADAGDIFIRAQNLKFDRLDLDDIAFVSLPEKSEGKRTRVQKGDLLITITGANVTKTALVDEDIGTAYVSQHVALFRPIEGVSSEFLYWFIVAAAAGRKQLEDFAYGAGKPGLNLSNIREVKLNLPSLQEQLVIVDRLNDALSCQATIQAAATEQLKRSASLRQSILKDAFAGRLVPQDPTDEPASALLARISEAKAQPKAGAKKTRRKARV